jgi:hypothetical protein
MKMIQRTEVDEDGEGTLTMTAAELLFIAIEEAPAITLDLERGRARLGENSGFGFFSGASIAK